MKVSNQLRFLAIVSLLVGLVGFDARAVVYLTVTGANVKRAKIAVGKVHPLPNGVSADPQLVKNIAEQVKADLEFMNLFEFMPDSAMGDLDKPLDFYKINYEQFLTKSVSFVLKLAQKLEGGKLTLEALLYDVPGQKKIFGTRYQYPANQFPRLVHAMSEDILKELTGEKGLFFSRILTVCRDTATRRKPAGNKEVFLIDPDGRNMTQLTFDRTLSLSPAWSPNGKIITYTQYGIVGRSLKKGTLLRRHNLQNGERKIISSKEGMNSGAAWMPNGKKIAVTLSFNGRPEIYTVSPDGGDPDPVSRNVQIRRVAGEGFQPNYPSLLFDVEPSYSPDGTKMVFSSARSGHPMIYTVDLNSNVGTQLTFAGTYNSSPDWSPKGDKILFAAQRLAEGNFDVYLIDPDGNNLTRVTAGESLGAKRKANSENPTWAPTGRHLAVAGNESGGYAIYTMSLDGNVKRRITPPNKECFDPAWGPAEN